MSKTQKQNKRSALVKTTPIGQRPADFDEVVALIEAARTRAVAAVNKELIDLYWNIGATISRRIADDGWGKGTVQALADYIQTRHPRVSGYSARNLWRMVQFYDTYQNQPKLSPLVRELSWTHNLLILSRCKRAEEREFYLRLSLRERWGKRELDRQLAGALFERTILSPAKLSPLVTELHPQAADIFKDAYLVEFLDLPAIHTRSKASFSTARRFNMRLRTRNILVLMMAAIAFAAMPVISTGEDKADAKATQPQKISVPYAVDHAKPLEPKEELVNQADDHTQYRVEFNGIKDDRVPAYLYVPKRKPDTQPTPFPAILLQYGTGGNKKTNYIVEIGKLFVSRGYVVLTIDSPNQGERRNKDKKSAGVFGLAGTDQVMHYCGDYSRAVDFLCSRPDVDKDRLGYVGISWGAITGIIYVAYDQRIKAMGSMVGGGNFLGLFTAEDAERCAREGSKSSDPVCHVARIAPRPLLFINVTKDQLIMRPWAESLHKYAGLGSKVVWHETDHYFRGLDRAAVCGSVIDFMDQELSGKRARAKE